MDRIRTWVLVLAFASLGAGQPVPTPGGEPGAKPEIPVKAKPLGGDWEVMFTDNSTMKVSLLDDLMELQTAHGALSIPVKDIRKIEFGVRLSPDEQRTFDTALTAVGSKEAKVREEGKTQLKTLGGKIAPFLKSALRKADAESRPHLEMVYEAVAGDREARKNAPRDTDTITTDESQFSGRIAASQLRIQTFQFGELKLRVTDARTLQSGGISAADDKIELVEPANFYQLFQTHMDKTVRIRVVGSNAGTVWGTGTYTADSNIGVAAVHAGAVKSGDTKIIKIRITRDPGGYVGSNANGIQSHPYGQFPTGAYEILTK